MHLILSILTGAFASFYWPTPSPSQQFSSLITTLNCRFPSSRLLQLLYLLVSLCSLSDVPLSPTITSLNLHCNHIPRIEGLTSAWHLQHLDLSSNCISQIEGLSSLTGLRTLNLSCNLITKVEGETSVLLPVNWCHRCVFSSSIYFIKKDNCFCLSFTRHKLFA